MAPPLHGSESSSHAVRKLLAVDAQHLDEALDAAIDYAARTAGVERSMVVASAGEQLEVFATRDPKHAEYIEAIQSWIGPGLEAAAHSPVLADCFVRGNVVSIESLDELPDSASVERNIFERFGVQSFLAIPIHVGAEVVGAQLFGSISARRHWTGEEIARLQHLAELIGIAIERRGARQALRASEERFRALTEHATELIAELDTRGVYCYVSPSARVLLGYEPEELIGKRSGEFVHPDDLAASRARLGHAIDSESESHVVHRVRHRDGSWRWFDTSGRAFRRPNGEIRIVSVARDISERRRIEHNFAQRADLERHVASVARYFLDVRSEDAGDAIRRALQETGELLGADRGYLISFLARPGRRSEAFEWNVAVAGTAFDWLPWLSPKVLAGETVHVPHVSTLPTEAARDAEVFASNGIRSHVGLPFLSGGKVLAYLVLERTTSEGAFSDEQLNALGVIGQIFVSALRRRHSQEQLSETHAQLAQSQKIEAVGRLAGGIAHDFNNLLTVILGFARPLLKDLEDHESLHDVGQIVDAAERAAALTGQLLSFSRRQTSDPQPIDVDKVIEGVEGMLGRLLEEDVRLAFDLHGSDCIVSADPHQIEQVLVNLAVNARDAMPGGGRLTVRTRIEAIDSDACAALDLEQPGEYVVLEVADTGTGMTPETREHSLEPFYTTKEQGKGTGLGLSIAYGVVRQFQGAIGIDSKPGAGTTIRIHLPRIADRAAVETDLAVEARRQRCGTILLVEDERAVRSLLRRLFESVGYDVIEAVNGIDALERFRSSAGIDALVTDVVMPRMGGFELARQLRDLEPELPVLYVSGYPEPRNASGDEETPEGVFVFKPFRPERLLGCLADVIESSASARSDHAS